MSNSEPFILSAGAVDELQSLRERISKLDEQITNLKRLENTIQRNGRLFEALLKASHDGIALTRPDATIIRVVNSILGYAPTMLHARSIYDVIHPEDHGVMQKCYREVVKNRVHQVHHNLRMLKADGSTVRVEGTITDMLDDPAVLAIVHNYSDVTWRNQAEITGLEFAAVIQHTPFSVFSKDLGGYIQSWNGTAERSFGYTAAVAIGQHIWKLVPVELQFEEKAVRATVVHDRTSVGPLHTVRVHKNGAHIPIDLTLTPMIKDGQVCGMVHLSQTLQHAG